MTQHLIGDFMKKCAWFLPILVALPIQAQSLLGALNQYQSSLEAYSTSTSNGKTSIKTPESSVQDLGESRAVDNGSCEENSQTSLPLSYVTSLLLENGGELDVKYDPRKRQLEVNGPNMISNCSSMLQWNMKERMIENKKVYAIELKIKQGQECSADGCKYKVAKVTGSTFKGWEMLTLKPTLEGFEECLVKSGVVEGGKINGGAIYSGPVQKKFTEVSDSGKVLFVSHGPSSVLVKPKYGKFSSIDKCDYFEPISAEEKEVISLQDEEKQRLDEEASKLKNCSINEYHKVSDFIEKYENYADELSGLLDNLLTEAAKKSAKALDENQFTDEDIKVMADFDKHIVRPKAERAIQLYNDLRTLDGTSEAAAKKQELTLLLKELKTLNSKPYFVSAHVKKLLNTGHFEDAVKLNTMKLILDNYSKLGSKRGKNVFTPEVAADNLNEGVARFEAALEDEKELYALRTGEITGKENYYRQLASRMRNNIQKRTANFNGEIQSEFGRMQPGGYCYAYYFRNSQKCVQDSMERVQELQALLKHYNQVDAERALEYDAEAEKFGKLEAEGRRYIAQQNGEEVPEEAPVEEEEQPVDNTVPAPRPGNGSYTFDYNPNQMQSMPQGMPQGMPMGMPQQSPGIQNPLAAWQSGGYNQPFMGQQAFQPNYGGYNFQWGGGQQQPQPYAMNGFQQPQQQGFWGQPYPAYNMPSMYGR